MQYDYLSMIEEKGFKMPEVENVYDEETMYQFIDRRQYEIESFLRLCLNDFIIEQSYPKSIRLRTVDAAAATVLRIEPDSISSDSFKVERGENGSYRMEREELSDILLIESYKVPGPGEVTQSETLSVQIDGYSQDVIRLYQQKSSKESIRDFIVREKIQPDMQRRIIFNLCNYSAISIRETSTVNDSPELLISMELKVSDTKRIFPIAESYLRARGFSEELRNLAGLPYSKTNEIKQLLKKRQD